MANAVRGEVPIPGTEYVLCLRLNEACSVEEEFGTDFASAMNMFAGDVRFSDIRRVFWAILRTTHKGMTIEEAGDAVSAVGLRGCVELLETALKAAGFTDEGEDAGKNP